jgi:hypothetical protein
MCDLTFGQNGHFNKKKPTKRIMFHAFNQNEHIFGLCKHLIKLNLLKSHDFLYVVQNNET